MELRKFDDIHARGLFMPQRDSFARFIRLGIVGLWSYESGLRIGPKSNLPRRDKCDFNRRIVIGLGVGQATLDTKVQVYQMANGNAT
jgi:hypothetical protein